MRATGPAAAVVGTVLGTGASVGASHRHAAKLLGLSTPVPPVRVLAVARRPPAAFPSALLEGLDGLHRCTELDPAAAAPRPSDGQMEVGACAEGDGGADRPRDGGPACGSRVDRHAQVAHPVRGARASAEA
ncbi:MAG: hypothetical protein U0838_00675 [Chloroflexota bacterium]